MLHRLARFLRKPPRDQAAAIRATLGALRGGRAEALLRGRHGPARALRTGAPLFLARRPESDTAFGRHPELPGLLAAWLAGNPANAGDLVRLYALVLNLKQVLAEGVPGDCAELGVYKGNSAAVIAHYARAAGRTTYLFDTFAGFAAAELDDPGNPAKAAAFRDTSQEAVARLVGAGVAFRPGRFPASVTPDLEAARFCFVHVDCDLYAPALAALAFFYPRLSPGGMLVLHDYANPHWEGIRRAADEFLAGRPERLVLQPDMSGTALLRRLAT